MTKEAMPIVARIITIAGILMCLLFIFCVYRDITFHQNSIPVQGIVTGLESRTSKDSDGNSSTTYAYKVKYTTVENKEVEFINSSSSSHPFHGEGDAIGVRYIPGTQKARVDGWFDSWGGTFISGIFAAAFALIWASPYLLQRGNKNTAESREKLVQFGLKMSGKFIRVKTVFPGNSSSDGPSLNGYLILVEINDPLTGLPKEYRSDLLWSEQKPVVTQTEFPVYIDQKNPKKYWVDTTLLEKELELQEEAALDKIIAENRKSV